MQCQLTSLEAMTPFVHRVRLTPAQPVSWRAGQYLQLNLSNGEKRFFSIANTEADGFIELHIGAAEHDSYAFAAIEDLQQQQQADVTLPLGHAWLREESCRPLILLAGGTGFSYVKAIAEQLQATGSEREVWLYWGNRNRQAMYQADLASQWAQSQPHFHFVPVVENPEAEWSGRTGLVHQAVMEDFVSLQPYEIYAAGRFEMVGRAREEFQQHGLEEGHMFSDAFEFI